MIKIGILGLGTVGTGTLELLNKNAKVIKDRSSSIEVEKILIKDLTKKRKISGFSDEKLNKMLTDNIDEVINDPKIKIIVELMGGEEPAFNYIKKALENGKHVVTANKEIISKKGNELVEIANKNGLSLYYEASVAGGIPIIRPLNQCLAGNVVEEIQGILNGTTNFMLTQMEEKGYDFNEILKKAQELGYAESDPTDDVEGYDAVRKLSILTSIATNLEIKPEYIPTEGISNISIKDISFLKNEGYRIKLLGYSKIIDNNIECRVSPVFISKKHPLYGISEVYNSVLIKANPVGYINFTGQGAGREATSSAVVADIMDIVRNIGSNNYNITEWKKVNKETIREFDTIKLAYYLRIVIPDNDKNTDYIKEILKTNKISTIKINSKELENGKEYYVITEKVLRKDMNKAIEIISDNNSIKIENLIRGDETNWLG